MKNYLRVLAALTMCSGAAQSTFTIPDSLSVRDYRYFSKSLSDTKDSALATVYAHTWLQKAKSENNTSQQLLAYRAVMHVATESSRFLYADTLLQTAKRTKDNQAIGSACLTVGAAYHNNKEYLKALDYYLLADKYVSRTGNEYLRHKVRYTIGSIKYYLGYYHEAIALLTDCIEYFQEENDVAYLKSLHSVALCYIGIKRYDLCSRYNELGLVACRELGNDEMIPYFKHSEGVNQYYRKNYSRSIGLLNESLPEIKAQKDFANETVAWFYIGKSNLALQLPDKAMRYFRRVDELVLKNNYIRPDLRENYELLIAHYQRKNDRDSLDYYVARLLHVDKKLNDEYKYLIGKVFKVYDTNKLLQTQKEIEESRHRDKILFSAAILALLLVISFMTYRHRLNQKYYRRKFEELMKERPDVTQPANREVSNELRINPEIVATVLPKLDKFEKTQKYTEKEMSLAKVAGYLDINTKYASQIIWHYRGKKFTDYINDLKVDYIVNLLKTERIYRNYTNEALADHAGFGSTQNFTRAFKERTEISPTYFIEQLKKTAEANCRQT